jgi:hypothetical protein
MRTCFSLPSSQKMLSKKNPSNEHETTKNNQDIIEQNWTQFSSFVCFNYSLCLMAWNPTFSEPVSLKCSSPTSQSFCQNVKNLHQQFLPRVFNSWTAEDRRKKKKTTAFFKFESQVMPLL